MKALNCIYTSTCTLAVIGCLSEQTASGTYGVNTRGAEERWFKGAFEEQAYCLDKKL